MECFGFAASAPPRLLAPPPIGDFFSLVFFAIVPCSSSLTPSLSRLVPFSIKEKVVRMTDAFR
jgi:hypothetical protein